MTKKKTLIAERDEEIEALKKDHHAMIERARAQLAERSVLIGQTEAQIARLEQALQQRFRELATLTQMALEAEKEQQWLTAELESSRHATKEVESRLARAASHVRALEHENMALRTSMSWRLTAPIRKVSAWLRPRRP